MTAASRSSCSHLRSRSQITKKVVLRFNVRSLNQGERCVWRDGRTKKPWRIENVSTTSVNIPLVSVCASIVLFLSRSFGSSLSSRASACLFSRCAFCPSHTHTHTHKRVLSFSHTFCSSSSLFRDRGSKSGASTGRPSGRLAASKALAELVHEIRMKSRRYVVRWSLRPINAQISVKDGSG